MAKLSRRSTKTSTGLRLSSDLDASCVVVTNAWCMRAVAGCRRTSPCTERTFPGLEEFDDRKKSQLATGWDQPKEKKRDRYRAQWNGLRLRCFEHTRDSFQVLEAQPGFVELVGPCIGAFAKWQQEPDPGAGAKRRQKTSRNNVGQLEPANSHIYTHKQVN